MMNRRQFVYAAAASVVTLARSSPALAADYDLVVKGGRVIDPSLRVNTIGDVAIAAGRIAAVEAEIAPDGAEVIDATGKLVVPGLLDVHTHYARDENGPSICLSDGVTGWVDAGSEGADQIDQMVAIARSAPQPARVLLNIGRAGILPEGDTMDLALADVDAAKAAIAENRDFVVGVKARLTEGVAADDVEVLRRAQEVATSFNLPVMIHMGQTASPMSTLIGQLKRGDIVTHMLAPPPNSLIDDDDHILPEVLAARRRGVWFDVANGRSGHLLWDTFDRILQAGFWPDTISTDGNTTSRNAESVIDFPNVMSKFLNFGMTIDQVVARATVNASRVYPLFRDRGTLNVGAPADVAVLDLREGSFEFVDNYGNTRTGRQRLFPSETVLGGNRVPRA
ncbi:MAG: amidohydrolase family protein [Vicinamibacterales bacterium]|jgi:dihydroorotase|nr:amidohydrolase family protein [Vicinamibacterales bacterium]